jgi:3-oxoacyl-[acyl-carrier protein] reductase
MDRDLAGRVAVVTGSAHNIGRAIALRLAEAGASVVITTLQAQSAAEGVASEIRASGGKAIVKLADVRDQAQVSALVAAAVEAFGGLDIVVNNAAVRHNSDLSTITYDDWRAVVSVILDGAFLMVHAARPYLVLSGAGSVINIGGMTAHVGAPHRVPLLAAKTGLIGMTRALAHDLSPQGVTVNCVVPGVMTTIRGSSATASLHTTGKPPPVGRRGTPADIAAVVHFLTGPGGRFVTGQTIHANGGALMP